MSDDLQHVRAEKNMVTTKQRLVEEALEHGGSYLGIADHDTLMEHLQSLRKEMEQLRDKELLLLGRVLTPTPLESDTSNTAAANRDKSGGRGGRGAAKRSRGDGQEDGKNVTASSPLGGRAQGLMRILVTTGKTFTIKAKPRDTVLGIKKKLKLPSGQLFLDGEKLEDSMVLSEVNPSTKFTNNSLVLESVESMQVSIKTLTGKHVAIHVTPRDTVLEMKKKLLEAEGIEPERARLVFRGRELKDSKTLAEFEVDEGATINMVLNIRGGKPVILLYPSAPLDVTVALELSPLWKLSALYPRPTSNGQRGSADSKARVAGGQQCEWSVHASPDGSLHDLNTGREYPYLFWEADSPDDRVPRSFGLDETQSFCVSGDAAGVFLDVALERLGLNARERCDMVTYWLPQLESSRFNVIFFVQTARYEQAARLTITPAPNVMIRIFMAFRGVDAYDAELDTAKVEELQAPARKGFVAVEWGGMNLNGASHN